MYLNGLFTEQKARAKAALALPSRSLICAKAKGETVDLDRWFDWGHHQADGLAHGFRFKFRSAFAVRSDATSLYLSATALR